MTGLTEFLLARIAEDEEAAQRGGGDRWKHRSLMRHPTSRQSVYADMGREIAEVEHLYGWHIARWDPARVLAECDAKRRIVERYRSNWAVVGASDGPVTMDVAYTDDQAAAARETEAVLRLLALPYADHPEWREEWRP